ncbi:MAG: hypothetical protein J6T88_07500 [Bacteroidales bacterium]|nr:hypothetical protein [Bacteroidales bacterium]
MRHPSPRGEGNGERRTESGERDTPRQLFCHTQFSSARHTPPLCGTPLREGRETGNGERRAENGKWRTENATHPAAVRHPSPRGEGNGKRERSLTY